MVSNIQKRTMRRVVAVYYLRKVLNGYVLKAGILGLTALGFGSLVHVAAVFNNMPSFADVGGVFQFSYYSFLNTEIAVQAVIFLLGVFTLWLARDVLRQLIPRSNMQYSHSHI